MSYILIPIIYFLYLEKYMYLFVARREIVCWTAGVISSVQLVDRVRERWREMMREFSWVR